MAGNDERDLEEVERALSVLGGRHPEQVRAERLAAEAAAKRRVEHERLASLERARSRKRAAIGVVVLGVVGVAGFFAWKFFGVRAALDAEVAPLTAKYVGLGFDSLPRGTFAAQDRAEATTVAGDCYALVAARSSQMHVTRPIGNAGAKGEAIVCTCASENLVVTTDGGAPVRILHVSGNALGGTRALAYRFGDHPPTIIAGDDACSDDALAAFARDKRYGKQDADGTWLAAHPSLATSGFVTVASAASRFSFVFVEPAPARCFVATGAEGDALTLWTLDGSAQKPVQHAKTSIAWCALKEAPFIVERDGHPTSGSAVVVAAPSRRVGGMLGLREVMTHAHVPITTWLRDEERGELAAETLRASVVPEPTVIASSQTIEAAQSKDARVLVFATATAESFVSSEADFRCTPVLAEPESLCVQPRALTWRAPPPGVVCAAAYGALPFWMSAIAESHDPSAVDAELALVSFSRRLAARGFSPTIIEGVTEHESTVEILGRSGDDAIVAVGLWPVAPFVHPYTDGDAWTLDGEPRVLPLTGGSRITLPIRAQSAASIDKRRTVVFRRSTK